MDSEPDMSKWLTGPALDIIVQLKAFEKGDQIKVSKCENLSHNVAQDLYFYDVPLEITHINTTQLMGWTLGARPMAKVVIPYDGKKDFRWFCPCSVRAWRRPS